jgi:hypothetical protein
MGLNRSRCSRRGSAAGRGTGGARHPPPPNSRARDDPATRFTELGNSDCLRHGLIPNHRVTCIVLARLRAQGFGFQRRPWRRVECRHPTYRERIGAPTLQTLQDPILLLPWVCFSRWRLRDRPCALLRTVEPAPGGLHIFPTQGAGVRVEGVPLHLRHEPPLHHTSPPARLLAGRAHFPPRVRHHSHPRHGVLRQWPAVH